MGDHGVDQAQESCSVFQGDEKCSCPLARKKSHIVVGPDNGVEGATCLGVVGYLKKLSQSCCPLHVLSLRLFVFVVVHLWKTDETGWDETKGV